MGRSLVFVGAVLAVMVGIHYYLWARLVRDPHLPPPWNVLATGALVLLAGSLPLILFVGRQRPDLRRLLAWPAYTWMGVMFFLLVAALGADLVRVGAWMLRRARFVAAVDPVDPERRISLARIAAAAIAAVAGGMTLAALRSALGRVAVRNVKVRLRRLPRAQHGLRIVQLTDIHVGPTIGRSFIQEIVRTTNALEPDLVAITGDLVDGSVAELKDAIAPLAQLRARHGVFFVTGNHEYFSGVSGWLEELPRLGIRVLKNERVSIGEGPDSFDLAGVEDRSAARYGGPAPAEALARTLAGRDGTRELVLLAHQPRTFLDALAFGVGLQLSGHTHGGQVWPFSYIVGLTQPFLAGLHEREGAQVYVSRGTGYWGPPLRLGAPAEITHLVLESQLA
jgi:predicted MPP superfamily phosphohydrolase